MNEPTISMSLSAFIAAILSAYRSGQDSMEEDEPEQTPPKETMQ